MHKSSFMLELKEVNMSIFKVVSARYKKMNLGVTPVHARIIMFINDNEGDVCQKDIEQHISCNKSTISAILNIMEKNNLIYREGSENDSRRKIIKLTDKAFKVVNVLKKDAKKINDLLCENITDDECSVFYNVLNKIRNNIERI